MSGALPVGVVPEPLWSMTLLRGAVGLVALLLLSFGRRLPRFAVGSFALAVSLAISWPFLKERGLLLALLFALALFAAALLVHEWFPRLATGVAAAWPLPLLPTLYALSVGSFDLPKLLPLLLVVAGFLLGVFAPPVGAALVGSALGTLLLVAVLPGEARFWPFASLFAVALALQLADLALERRRLRGEPEPSRRPEERPRRILRAIATGGAALLAAALFVVATAPRIAPPDANHAARVGSLRERLPAGTPLFVVGTENVRYLLDRPLPFAVALPGGEGSAPGRLAPLLRGRALGGPLEELRAVKDAGEIDRIRRACAITSRAFADVAPLIRPGSTEREIADAIAESFRRQGADGLAFESVVASGRNATLPHYSALSATLRDGLVVIDIGSMVGGYASDMTRTFPVRGRATKEEERLYALVLEAKERARRYLRPGVSLRDLDRLSREPIEKAGLGDFFNHGLSHHVGIDVHDSGGDLLAAGMVVTLEPGIYVPSDSTTHVELRGLGIRIEDTYLVTSDGAEALTSFPERPVR
jgi:hypothetical protein